MVKKKIVFQRSDENTILFFQMQNFTIISTCYLLFLCNCEIYWQSLSENYFYTKCLSVNRTDFLNYVLHW